MKILIAAAALSLVAGAAFAGEGNGDPYALRTAGYSVQTSTIAAAKSASQNPYPFTVSGGPWGAAAILPVNGSNGPVQTANSLPVGFASGTAAYQRGQQFDAWMTAQHLLPVRTNG